ncbi:MAG: outer membrane beta-barrel protein [Holophagaceae bacterium]|nr:outer membrane beta-barrel protein [Holophagaceae bacterium]
MKSLHGIALMFVAMGSLQAQSPNFGLQIRLGAPIGELREKIYPPNYDLSAEQIEGYDIGLGLQFTMSFPLHQKFAFRAGIGGMSTRGTNTASGYDTIFLRHNMFSLSGELQLFLQDAYRHQGTFLTVGISGNFERFERSFEDNWSYSHYWYYPESDVTRKSRLGGIIGIGHTFYGHSNLNFTTELSYHHTLTNSNINRGEPPSANFFNISFGLIF